MLWLLLDLLWAGRQRTANLWISHMGHILSTGEALPVKQPPVCSACYRQGYIQTSRNCPLKLQASIASQNQLLLDSEVAVAEQQQLAIRPTTTISIMASIPATTPLPSYSLELSSPVSIPGSQVSVNIQLSSPIISPRQLELQPKQLSPDRPEVLMQAYLAEKQAWLAQHPTVRPTEYRKARKWKTLRPKVLKEQAFYMPKERRDLDSNIISNKAN